MRDEVGLFSTAEINAIFSAEEHVRDMLAFEAALARAEARAAVIPQEAATAIVSACRVELFDVAGLLEEASLAGNMAIPLVRALTTRVAEPGRDYVHWGTTSQDVIDTALVLQMRDGLTYLEADLLGVCAACAALAAQHRHTLMSGRTWLQQAVPITFGLKAARWLAMAARQVYDLRECRAHSLAIQFGGAAGTLAALGDAGLRVAEMLGEELKLPVPDLPWHAERDRIARVATALGIAADSMAKIATDIILLAQTEVQEVSEGAAPAKGTSSAMPQKRNPVDATLAVASARLATGEVPVILLAMAQEHERAAGGWQAEWAAVPDLFRYTAGALAHARGALEGLQVDPQRMRENLARDGGRVMSEALSIALAAALGRQKATRLVKEAGARALGSGRALRDIASEDAQIFATLGQEGIDKALDPALYLGSANLFIDRTLESYRALVQEKGRRAKDKGRTGET
jgi:3-carboxy-cis,cis-muconate cycloisomerase